MRTVASLLMAGLLLLQSLTGLCCHHPCDCARVESAMAEQHPHSNSGCCHHCKSDHHQQVPTPTPCKRNHCLGICTYVRSSKVQIDDSWQYAAIEVLNISAISVQAPTSPTIAGDESNSHLAEPPLRLHLLHQSILI